MACNLDWSRHICLHDDHINGAVKKEMSHIINYHHQLNQSLLKEEQESELWDSFSIYDFEALHHDNYLRTQSILEQDIPQYTLENNLGFYHNYKIEDLLFDLFQHSAHHRGKISLLFKQLELPAKTHSYLLYKRGL
ncbi:DinB family protein [Lishizhenia tianjinensis]|uniref:DinB family protein n=2 Tax=Lishizhenia tianjinensis TaxID=477690 RepID=A0A1I6Y7T5_9FLAO|nr:DinB family protein [Lishizhenia tianjinensis]